MTLYAMAERSQGKPTVFPSKMCPQTPKILFIKESLVMMFAGTQEARNRAETHKHVFRRYITDYSSPNVLVEANRF